MPALPVWRTTVLAMVSLPPARRSSRIPCSVNPSMLVFSITTETPAGLGPLILIPCTPLLSPLMSSQFSRTVLKGSAAGRSITMPSELVATIEP